jgi:RNA polymerase sigma-70 factor (ECF subfamily)
MNAPFDFGGLVREARPQLVRFLGRMVGEADAEDVAQVVLSKAAAARASFRGEASPRTWLYRIATNAARDWLRRSRPPLEALETTNESAKSEEPTDWPVNSYEGARCARDEPVRREPSRLPNVIRRCSRQRL